MVAIHRTGDYDKMLEDLTFENEELLELVRNRVKLFRMAAIFIGCFSFAAFCLRA